MSAESSPTFQTLKNLDNQALSELASYIMHFLNENGKAGEGESTGDITHTTLEKGSHTSEYGKTLATSSVAAEAEQGDGPAAASASSSAVGEEMSTSTSSVSVVVGPHGAAAACDIAVVAVGPYGASAASEVGVVSVGPHGAAASSNAANSNRVAIDREDHKDE
ncbi:hypothetical protein [Marininema halotolerans]|uniref:Uncharacterized protein n=1 Tax=Marininema halotolerans TaxID=1155944 RepID=A0A1I6SIW6_9BACL|nr:hypothetical protein [Marininema halotolerans]SFS76886.1 hypothetical protein SAMN05444972_107127 [Marininema halotolerans]